MTSRRGRRDQPTGHEGRHPAEDDAQWRRPADWQPVPPVTPTAAPPPRYDGPPPTQPPPGDWRPPVMVTPSAPRALVGPPADLDEREQQARTITYGVAMAAGAVVLVLLFVFCGRALL